MSNQILEMWQRILRDNISNLSGMYDSMLDLTVLFIGVGAIACATAIIISLFRGK